MTDYNVWIQAKLKKQSVQKQRSVLWRFNSFIGGMPVPCLSERIVGVILLVLSGYSFADGLVIGSSASMTVASIAPLPMELVAPVPEPQSYLQRYEMESQANQVNPFYPQIANFYSAQVTHDFRFGNGNAIATPEAALQRASSFLRQDPVSAPLISIVQLPDPALMLGAQPQRRLSLTVNDWVFSATGRLAILHSHETGMTFTVRHGF
jgi:hypothetical protein